MLLILGFVIHVFLASTSRSSPTPSGDHSQYFFMNDDGSYRYGYATGDGVAAEQSGNSKNEVTGRYRYHNFDKEVGEKNVDLRYTAGKNGFTVADGYEEQNAQKVRAEGGRKNFEERGIPKGQAWGYYVFSSEAEKRSYDEAYRRNKGLAANSRAFSVVGVLENSNFDHKQATNPHFYSHSNGRGFGNRNLDTNPQVFSYSTEFETDNDASGSPSSSSSRNFDDGEANTGDASYSFAIDTDEYKRQESSDPSGNVRGFYSYTNDDGVVHDLSYEAGDGTGFVVKGGSLANPFVNSVISPDEVHHLARSFPKASRDGESATVVVVENGEGGVTTTEPASEDGDPSATEVPLDNRRRELPERKGNRGRGYFFQKNPDGTHTVTYYSGSDEEQNGIPHAFFKTRNYDSHRRSSSGKGLKPSPPEPVPYPQSKTAYGVDGYVVRTYVPRKNDENNGKFGYYFRY